MRDGDRTVLTMGSDFKGEPSAFALVVPVPTVLQRGQIHVGDQAIVEHLDQYSAPRLVEYFDEDPCRMRVEEKAMRMMAPSASGMAQDAARANALGVRIEARYTVGEYDILILSATQSSGLVTWLKESHYRIPDGAERVLGSYLRQGMKFFVAKVNLKEQAKTGFSRLRPLQMAYESPKFMLPIRLGMVNADGPQELLIYALTRQGRVECTNYRTVKLPSDAEVPLYVKEIFAEFYRATFTTAARREGLTAVFTEYAWDMSWCDPCASQPLSNDELRGLGVFWLDDAATRGGASGTFVTRLHVRYDAVHFPEDLVFQQTSDRANFQGRYIMRHAWTGTSDCEAAAAYRAQLRERREKQAETLAALTGWNLDDVRGRMQKNGEWSAAQDSTKWWERLWK